MRFVESKSEARHSAAILHRSRQRLVRQRTETVNALRAALYEFGHVIPQGIQHVGNIRAMLETRNSDLPTLMREECLAMFEQIAVLNDWIDTKTARIRELAAATPVSKRLQTMSGVVDLIAPFAATENRQREIMIADLIFKPLTGMEFHFHQTDPATGKRIVQTITVDAGEKLKDAIEKATPSPSLWRSPRPKGSAH